MDLFLKDRCHLYLLGGISSFLFWEVGMCVWGGWGGGGGGLFGEVHMIFLVLFVWRYKFVEMINYIAFNFFI